MLATNPRTFFHYMRSPTKYRHGLRTHRHDVTTYVKKNFPKNRRRMDFVKPLGKLGYGCY